jgi:DNA mismatch repair protein MutS
MSTVQSAGDSRSVAVQPPGSGDGREVRPSPYAGPSILSIDSGAEATAPAPPAYFGDLHLDQIVAAVTAEREEYELEAFFAKPLGDRAAVLYRHEVVVDLEEQAVRDAVEAFAAEMREARQRLALSRKLRHVLQRQRWLVAALGAYCEAVDRLEGRLVAAPVRSAGLSAVTEYLTGYVHSTTFAALREETGVVEDGLAALRYTIHVKGAWVRVDRYESRPDLTAEVQRTFAKFKHGPVEDRRVEFRAYPELNHVEAQILDRVAAIFPEAFSALGDYCKRYHAALDATVLRFDRELQFYLSYLEHIEPLRARGLPFCLPEIVSHAEQTRAADGFDLSLAVELGADSQVVFNDFALTGPERILVVTGPNQGGKTTFARMFGQLHYLAGLGLPVPAAEARLQLADRLFTHFEREESLKTLRGKFEDELVRIRAILEQATAESVLIMNESFGSTTLGDALAVGGAIVGQIIALDALCVFVTFVDELATLGEATVSMMSMVDPDDRARRTYRIARKPADGLAYATALAAKYELTYDSVRRRIS